MDAGKLLQEGRLEIFCLSVSMDNTASAEQNSWNELLQWQDQLLTAKPTEPVVFMVDDVDMLELVAPNAQTARRFLVRSLDYLRTSSVEQNREGDTAALHSVVVFGRHPQETMAQLSSLGATALLLSNTGGQSGGATGSSSTGQGSRAPVSEEDDGQPALVEFLRYRLVSYDIYTIISYNYTISSMYCVLYCIYILIQSGCDDYSKCIGNRIL